MRKFLGGLIWLGFLYVAGPALLGIVLGLAKWFFTGFLLIVCVCLAIVVLLALLG